MNKKILTILILLSMATLAFTGCKSQEAGKIMVVLDWTPNTNHTGLYVAQEKGYFKDLGLDVEIVQPPEGGAESLVASGKAQFGIAFQDMIAPAFASDDPLPVTAVAAIVQHNTSGIISIKGTGIGRPKGMVNKVYASWDMPIEKAMIKKVVEADGGDYDLVKMVPSTVTDVVAALSTDIDAVWVYYGWDGIATKVKGLETDFFAFKDIDPVLDYYSPVIIANNDYLANHGDTTRDFLKAVAQGFEFAIDQPEEAAKILTKLNPELDETIALESQRWLADEYKAGVSPWGYIDQKRWDNFFSWLWEEDLIENKIPTGFGFTNDYLPN